MSEAAGRGVFRRRICALASGNRVEAAVEDDFHHMEVTLVHDGVTVREISGRFPRPPWSTCPGAVGRLPDLIGLPISTRCWDLPADLAAKLHCTHLLDTALLAIAQAARGGERRYELRVPDRDEGATSPSVLRDGHEVLCFDLEGDDIVAPPPLAGQNMRKIMPWLKAQPDDELLEAISLMRRALLVSRGRAKGEAARRSAAELIAEMAGACFTFQPGIAEHATLEHSRRVLSDRPQDFTLPV